MALNTSEMWSSRIKMAFFSWKITKNSLRWLVIPPPHFRLTNTISLNTSPTLDDFTF